MGLGAAPEFFFLRLFGAPATRNATGPQTPPVGCSAPLREAGPPGPPKNEPQNRGGRSVWGGGGVAWVSPPTGGRGKRRPAVRAARVYEFCAACSFGRCAPRLLGGGPAFDHARKPKKTRRSANSTGVVALSCRVRWVLWGSGRMRCGRCSCVSRAGLEMPTALRTGNGGERRCVLQAELVSCSAHSVGGAESTNGASYGAIPAEWRWSGSFRDLWVLFSDWGSTGGMHRRALG